MKRFILFIAAMVLTFSASAQKKGEMSIGGAIGVSNSSLTAHANANGVIESVKLPSETKFSLNPRFSYFVTDNLELSAGLEYGMEVNSSFDENYTVKEVSNVALFQIGLHYFVKIVNGFYYTPGFDFGIGGGSFIEKNKSKSIKVPVPFALGCAFNLGKFEFRPTPHLGFSVNLLDLTVSDVKFKTETVADVELKTGVTGFNFGLNYGASVGVKYYF